MQRASLGGVIDSATIEEALLGMAQLDLVVENRNGEVMLSEDLQC